ncbi:hypothetical protein [Actinomyces sp.]
MSTIARVTAPILLILAAYIGGGAELMLQHSLAGTGDSVWIIAILIAGLANLTSILWLQRDASARSLALWGLLLKLCLLPLYIGFLPSVAFLAACLMAPPYLVLAIGYLFTLICGMYALLLTSSQYGIAAALRANTEGLLSTSSKRRYITMHCLPFSDLISSIWLCILLHRANKPASAAASES